MSSPVVQRVVRITDKDPLGLHIRPAEQFVRLAMKFTCEIEVVRENLRVDGKSIMHMLTLGAEPGTELVLEARGDDAAQAVAALERFIDNGFAIDETECQSQG
jgi:phosphotransferase system HPr (HPr) family protein